MGVTRHLANYSDTCLGASLISLSQPQLDWLHRAGDVDGLIVLYEGKIELMRQMTALQEDIKNSRRGTASSNASANSLYPVSSAGVAEERRGRSDCHRGGGLRP